MKRSHKIKIISMMMVFSFTGCNHSVKMEFPFEKAQVAKYAVPMLSDANHTYDFISSDLCIVPVGEDNGNDTDITGISSLLFNITNKSIIYADNIYEKIYPASLTKLMTALVALDQGNLTDVVTVSYNASHIQEVGAKLCGIEEGDQIVLGDLLTALLVYSGNDAGIAIAEHIAGSEEAFANMMNEKAASIGAVGSHFVNSHGLHDENQYSTAYDLYLIFQKLIQYQEAKDIIAKASYTMTYKDAEGNERKQTYSNTNKYLKKEKTAPENLVVEGGKTGTTNAAGNCLEILVEDEAGNSYIAIVLKASGSDSLYQQMNTLIKKIKS